MRRSARVLMLLGTLSAVFGMAKLHALTHVYLFTASGRLLWAFAYVGVMSAAADATAVARRGPSFQVRTTTSTAGRSTRSGRREMVAGTTWAGTSAARVRGAGGVSPSA
jgi:hypothetical protein